MTHTAIKIAIGVSVVAALAGFGAMMVSGAPESVPAATATENAATELNPAFRPDRDPARVAQALTGTAQNFVPAGTLPGGASSLQESYQDWQVVCAQQVANDQTGAASPVKRCVMNQQQVERQNQQRVLAIELAPAGDKLEGALVLPFGLALDEGAALRVDDGPAGPPLRFRTCLPAGCVIPLSFDAANIAALRKGGMLKVKVVADGGGDTLLPISLKGFAAAYSRVAALSR
jgi:invasion protein IalB